MEYCKAVRICHEALMKKSVKEIDVRKECAHSFCRFASKVLDNNSALLAAPQLKPTLKKLPSPSNVLQFPSYQLAMRYLKCWLCLAKPADPFRLYFPKEHRGLGLSSISGSYQKLRVGRTALLITSRDRALN